MEGSISSLSREDPKGPESNMRSEYIDLAKRSNRLHHNQHDTTRRHTRDRKCIQAVPLNVTWNRQFECKYNFYELPFLNEFFYTSRIDPIFNKTCKASRGFLFFKNSCATSYICKRRTEYFIYVSVL